MYSHCRALFHDLTELILRQDRLKYQAISVLDQRITHCTYRPDCDHGSNCQASVKYFADEEKPKVLGFQAGEKYG